MRAHERNQPCWCGSGKKRKKCHGSATPEAPSIWDIRKQLQKLHATKDCLHPSAGPDTCRGGVIRAHTVRRAADLLAIAKAGHVYQVDSDIATLQRTSGRVSAKLVGINSASTFWGFCQIHDATTFSPLETEAFGPTDQQAFLLLYRPLAKELYLKLRARESAKIARGAALARGNRALASQIEGVQCGIDHAIKELQHYKANLDAQLVAGDIKDIRYCAVLIDRPPDIMCSGIVQPRATFAGEELQDLSDLDHVLGIVSFSLVACGTRGAAVFSWPSECDAVAGDLVDSLLSLPREEIPAALIRYAFSEFENIFIRPDWWDGLASSTRKLLEDRMQHNVGWMNQTSSGYLLDDGVRPAEWVVTDLQQRRA